MAFFSSLVATLMLLIALVCFQHGFSAWSTLEPKARSYIIFVSAYFALLSASGWLYVSRRENIFGIIHVALMLGIAGLGIGSGVLTYFNRWHIVGGSGPDANPTAPVVFLTALAATIVGIIAAICAAGVVWSLYAAKKKESAKSQS